MIITTYATVAYMDPLIVRTNSNNVTVIEPSVWPKIYSYWSDEAVEMYSVTVLYIDKIAETRWSREV